MAGRDDHFRVRLQLHDRVEHRKSLAHPVGIGRQTEVQRHNRGSIGAERGERPGPIAGYGYVVGIIRPFELCLQPLVVLDDQQFRLSIGHHAASLSLFE